ncbi:MAG: MauE/DoxX family redox-associated membrane protein [Akkermansia sp.]
MLREKIVRICMFLLRVGMGGFFLFVAGRKLLHLDQLQATIDRFSIFPEAWGHPLASLGVACEIVVGLGLLFRRTCVAALLGSALIHIRGVIRPGLGQGFPLLQLHRRGEGGNQLSL